MPYTHHTLVVKYCTVPPLCNKIDYTKIELNNTQYTIHTHDTSLLCSVFITPTTYRKTSIPVVRNLPHRGKQIQISACSW